MLYSFSYCALVDNNKYHEVADERTDVLTDNLFFYMNWNFYAIGIQFSSNQFLFLLVFFARRTAISLPNIVAKNSHVLNVCALS